MMAITVISPLFTKRKHTLLVQKILDTIVHGVRTELVMETMTLNGTTARNLSVLVRTRER